MATPRGAEHRDLEQKFKRMQVQINRLSAAVLRQRRLQVSEGSLRIKAPGVIASEYPNGQVGVEFGPMTPNPPYEHGLTLRDDSGVLRTWFGLLTSGGFSAQFGNGIGAPLTSFGVMATDTISMGDTSVTDIAALHGKSLELTAGSDGVMVDATGTASFGQGASACYIGYAATGSAANAVIGVDGRVFRSTSSARYKQDVQPAVVDPALVLQLEPHTFRSVAEVAEVGEDAPRYVGFIAEELHDAGLGLFVDYDDQGRPDAIQYDRLSVALLAVVKDQQGQLDAITARLDALESAA